MTQNTADPGFEPVKPNPYIVGNPVRDSKMFFGRQAEFSYVRKRFLDSERGGLLVFCGERRSGKTSILFQILDGRLGADFIPVLIDMQSMAVQNEVDFLSRIATEIRKVLQERGERVPPPDFGSEQQPSAAFLDFIRNVLDACPGKKPILLFDEYELFENKIDSGILSEDALHMLSHLMETYSVFLIFTGSQHVEQRKQDYWKLLGRSLHRAISYLTHDDALHLIRQPVAGRVHYESGTDEQIFRLTAGQPFYTQAICQNLVDHLNVEETNTATPELLFAVVKDIVDNPFPQMIFLWESLTRDEKLVLGLLAERLESADDHSSARDLGRLLSSRKYPLDLDEARIATALEKLFKQELLLKNDESPPGYAYRVDLWRHWVKRMHTVWQIMREEGMAIPRRRVGVLRLALPFALVVALGVVGWQMWKPPRQIDPPTLEYAFLQVRTQDGATIYRDGQVVGMGEVQESIPANVTYDFRVTAPGFADTAFSLTPSAHDSLLHQFPLRPLLGGVHIETEPPGATVTVDGRPQQGTTPLLIENLPIGSTHRLMATLPGFEPVERDLDLRPDSVVTLSIPMARQTTDVVLVTTPSGAELYVDGEYVEKSPFRVRDLPIGRHRFRFVLDGFVAVDSTLDVGMDLGTLEVLLVREPPGLLTIQGDHPAAIYVDQRLIVRNVQFSGAREFRGGRHEIRVVLPSGETVQDQVEIKPGESIVYDYTQRRVVQKSMLGGDGK